MPKLYIYHIADVTELLDVPETREQILDHIDNAKWEPTDHVLILPYAIEDIDDAFQSPADTLRCCLATIDDAIEHLQRVISETSKGAIYSLQQRRKELVDLLGTNNV